LVTSTTLLIARTPIASSRRTNQSGLGLIFTLRRMRAL
jgi:hypothetical protein